MNAAKLPSPAPPTEETLKSNVVAIACPQRHPRSQLAERARDYSLECASMGHCVERGFGMVEDGGISLFDAQVTPMVFDAIRNSGLKEGIRVRVQRRIRDGDKETTHVRVLEPTL